MTYSKPVAFKNWQACKGSKIYVRNDVTIRCREQKLSRWEKGDA